MQRTDQRFKKAFQACLECRTGNLSDSFVEFLLYYTSQPVEPNITAYGDVLKGLIPDIMAAAKGDQKEYGRVFWEALSEAANAYDNAFE